MCNNNFRKTCTQYTHDDCVFGDVLYTVQRISSLYTYIPTRMFDDIFKIRLNTAITAARCIIYSCTLSI